MFDIMCIDETAKIFCIIRKDAASEGMYKELPITVHGFLKENGTSYQNSMILLQNISDEAFLELDELMAKVQLHVWQVD